MGRAAEIMQLIMGLAAFRQRFASLSELEAIAHPVPLSRGPATPGLVCLPSFVSRSAAQEYARFAREFHGVRAVSTIPAPGFVDGEPLPATVDALLTVHAENIRRSVNGAPFVFVGHSSGGLVAHALATHLESVDMAPAAVVLMDTFTLQGTEKLERFWPVMSGIVLADNKQLADPGEDAWLTAMAHYFSLDWRGLSPTEIPTLLVRPREPIGESADDGEWKSSWDLSSRVTVVDVPGDHFTMMRGHADTTAQAVSEWVAQL
jgi:thioesterase domain-containing protein